jgi:hypothetical protein
VFKPAPDIAKAWRIPFAVFGWAATILFVHIGWLLFFYPVDRAATMAFQLFVR